LLGKKVGDIAEFNVSAGAITLEIRKIELAK